MPPPGSLPPVSHPGTHAEAAPVPQQFAMPPQMAVSQTKQSNLPGWVRALAVIVSILKMLPLLLFFVAVVVIGSAFDVAGLGLLIGLIFLIPAAILGIQIYVAAADRRLGLQITAGIFAALDALSLAATLVEGQVGGLIGLGVVLAVAQIAVFVGSLIDPSK